MAAAIWATAQWIGFIVMAAGCVMIAALVCSMAAEAIWRAWCDALSMRNVSEAIREWKERHPEKSAAWAKRRGESA